MLSIKLLLDADIRDNTELRLILATSAFPRHQMQAFISGVQEAVLSAFLHN